MTCIKTMAVRWIVWPFVLWTNALPAPSFKISTIDTAGDVGYFTSIAVDKDDKVHIGYLSKSDDCTFIGLRYASNSSGAWSCVQLRQVGDMSYTSIECEQNGNIPICFSSDMDVLYMYANKGPAEKNLFTPEKDVSLHGPAMDIRRGAAADSLEWLFLSIYPNTDQASIYIITNSFSMDKKISPSGLQDAPIIISLPQNNKKYIGYTVDNKAYACVCSTDASVPTPIPSYTSDISPFRKSTHYAAADKSGAVRHFRDIPKSFRSKAQDFVSMVVDSSDYTHAVYFNQADSRLMYVTDCSGAWQTFTIDSSITAGDTTWVIIEYFISLHSEWRTASYKNYVGEYNSIAIDGKQNLHVAYYDRGKGDLKYCLIENKGATPSRQSGAAAFENRPCQISLTRNGFVVRGDIAAHSRFTVYNCKGDIIFSSRVEKAVGGNERRSLFFAAPKLAMGVYIAALLTPGKNAFVKSVSVQ
jgi:hypothetical protein